MNHAISEAIANADAHVNNVGLPTYSDLATALAMLHVAVHEDGSLDGDPRLVAVCQICDRMITRLHGPHPSASIN
jgi:hypothetical protein